MKLILQIVIGIVLAVFTVTVIIPLVFGSALLLLL